MEKLKILLLEDNKLDAELTKEELKLHNFNFTSKLVETEKDFISAIHNFKPDLILSDYSLPQFTGFEALEIAKDLIPEIPFIIVTGSLTEETAVESINRGAWNYVIKENLIRLTPAIENALKLKEEKDKNKIAEAELIKLSTAVTQSPSVIAITNLKGNLEYVNPRFTELTGYTFDEAVGLNPSVLKSGEQPDEMYKELWETISSGEEWRGEFHNKKKDGKLFWEAATVSPIFDKQGKIINYLKVAEDITERKRAQQIQNVLFNISNAVIRTNDLKDLIEIIRTELGNLVDTKNFYIALYDSKTDTISSPFMADEKDSFTSFPAGKTLTYYVIKTEKPLLATKEKLKELEESGEVEGFGSDSEIWLGVPLKIKGKVTGVFAVQSYTDEYAYDESDCEVLEFIADQISISIDRKKAEEELILALEKATESDRLKTAFLNNFSHEIRTPMNGILGFVGLLKEPELTGTQKQKFIQIIETSSNRMLCTVDDLVNISMIESGQVKISISEANVNEQTEDIHRLLKYEAENKGLNLLLQNTLPDNEVEISTDSAKLYGILTNIVKNAIKFTHKGSIVFGYHLVDKNLEFFVADSGIGIPEDRQTAIFDRFVKADIEDKAVFEGSGLGLSIAKAYVEMLGGNIWVESKDGVGSKFYFTIPYNPITKELAKVESKTPSEKSGSLPKKITMLIVEDEDVVSEYLSLVLNDLSDSLLYSSNGFEAVEICRNNRNIDLVLMDLKMPIMGGYEATRKIRSFNKDVIIIAQTAYALKGDREKAIEVGCNDYISKPINKDELIEKIGKWFHVSG